MKKSMLFICLLLFCSIGANAQLLPGGTDSSLLGPKTDYKNMDSSVFIDVYVKAMDFNKVTGYEIGAKLGNFVNKNFSVAVGLNYLLSQNIIISKEGDFLSSFHLGITPEFVQNSQVIKQLYFFANCYLGAGYADYNRNSSFTVEKPFTGEWFILAEPSLGLYAQITKDIALGASAGKRISSHISLKSLNNKALQGFFGVITFRVLLFPE